MSNITKIGTVVGAAILALGLASLILNIGLIEYDIDETYGIDDRIAPFTLRAPEGTVQMISISAEAFDTEISTLNSANTESHEDSVVLEWVHDSSGTSALRVTNTGAGELRITGTLYSETEWIRITYDLFVMISGLVIIGFSAGFGRRKPRGF